MKTLKKLFEEVMSELGLETGTQIKLTPMQQGIIGLPAVEMGENDEWSFGIDETPENKKIAEAIFAKTFKEDMDNERFPKGNKVVTFTPEEVDFLKKMFSSGEYKPNDFQYQGIIDPLHAEDDNGKPPATLSTGEDKFSYAAYEKDFNDIKSKIERIVVAAPKKKLKYQS